MAKVLSIVSSIITTLAFNFFFIIKYFHLDNPFVTHVAIFIFAFGGTIYLITTIVAYYDCDNRDMSPTEKEFWKNLLIRCNYHLSGTPIYYSVVSKKPLENRERTTYKSIECLKGDMVYNIFRFGVYSFIILLLLSALTAVISLIYIELVNTPPLLFEMAIFMLLPFITIIYVFYLGMLYGFVQESRDLGKLIYYFSQSRWLFGVVKYYKESRKLRA